MNQENLPDDGCNSDSFQCGMMSSRVAVNHSLSVNRQGPLQSTHEGYELVLLVRRQLQAHHQIEELDCIFEC
jgi:hypothetical protein